MKIIKKSLKSVEGIVKREIDTREEFARTRSPSTTSIFSGARSIFISDVD